MAFLEVALKHAKTAEVMPEKDCNWRRKSKDFFYTQAQNCHKGLVPIFHPDFERMVTNIATNVLSTKKAEFEI